VTQQSLAVVLRVQDHDETGSQCAKAQTSTSPRWPIQWAAGGLVDLLRHGNSQREGSPGR
jgi:hypothetical protein